MPNGLGLGGRNSLGITLPQGTEGSLGLGAGLGLGLSDQQMIDSALENLFQRIPKLRGTGFNVVDSRGTERDNHFSPSEFFQPGETRNHPNPGKPTVEIFEGQELSGLSRTLFGESLHFAAEAVPEFADLREKYRDSLTAEQKEIDQRAYEFSKENFGEKRTFDKWFEVSRLDAHIRGFLAPDDRDEWAGSYTDEQLNIFDEMFEVLSSE